jgi:very-short-patch-repair endonuclease
MKAHHRVVSARIRAFAKDLRSNQTSLEDLVWRELRAKRLDGWKFKRQVPIEGYIVDFACFEAKTVVEVDGPLHSEPGQRMTSGMQGCSRGDSEFCASAAI